MTTYDEGTRVRVLERGEFQGQEGVVIEWETIWEHLTCECCSEVREYRHTIRFDDGREESFDSEDLTTII